MPVEDAPQMLEMFYEGKAKKLYSTSDPDLVIAYFKDDATAFNGKKKDTIEDKGVMNNRISELFFLLLEKQGVKTHFVRRLNDREMLCKRLDIIPVETVVRNIVAGSMAKRLGRESWLAAVVRIASSAFRPFTAWYRSLAWRTLVSSACFPP